MAMDHDVGPPRAGEPSSEGERAAAADYVAELSAELATLARQHGLTTLGFILDMARLEAENANRHVNGRR
jgi:hypothetical protein